MTTVYQFGEAQLTKDMIFGWCFRATSEDNWLPLSEFPTEVLQGLADAEFPTYVPEDLQSSLRSILTRREKIRKQGEETLSWISGEWAKYRTEQEASRLIANQLTDRVNLMTEIFSKMSVVGGMIESDLGYAKLSKRGIQWKVVGRDKQDTYHFDDINQAIDRIMARWW